MTYVLEPLLLDDSTLFDNLLLVQRTDLPAVNWIEISDMLRARSSPGLTLETAINVSDMTLGEDAKGLGEVDERWALTGVNAAQPDDSDLGKAACVGLEYGIDERGRSDADGGNLGGGNGREPEHLPDGILDTFGDLRRRRRLVMSEDSAARLVKPSHVDEDTVRVRTCINCQ